MFQMNPLAAVSALAAFVTYGSSEKSSLPQLGHFLHIWEALRRDMNLYTLFSVSTETHISLVKGRPLDRGETLRNLNCRWDAAEC